MFNNYSISPINYDNSIFLAYDNGQPFASAGSKTLTPGSPRVRIPSAPPEDGQLRALISEFLRLDWRGDIGPQDWWKPEAGPLGKSKNLYRSHPRSQYACLGLNNSWAPWSNAKVSFEGRRVRMLWNDENRKYNPRATELARQTDTVLPSSFTQSYINIRGEVYLVLSQIWMPCTDINTKKYPLASDFERVARPLFKGWWRAIKIDKGWRLYADDKNELFFAKLAIPV